MKINILSLYFLIIVLQACSLDVNNLTNKDSSSFPADQEDMSTALIAVYAQAGYTEKTMGWAHPFAVSELMSDMRFGGGGLHDVNTQSINAFKSYASDMYDVVWKCRYTGIYRANYILENIDRVEYESDQAKGKIAGQAHFLRAYLYMDLARMFERVPLILSTVPPQKIVQAEPEDVWAQIFTDLQAAVSELPAVAFDALPKSEDGTATKWAAEGLLARAFLFYTGYYQESSAPLNNGTLTKEEVVAAVDDCVANSGHDLIPDFRNLWPYAVANPDYGYAKENNLQWIGEDGDNYETVWALKFNGYGDRSWSSNEINLGFGIRQQFQVPIGKGWGYGPVNPQAYQDWPDEDIRKTASIYSVEAETDWVSGYVYNSTQAEETGFWQKKYMPINIYDENDKPTGFATVLYGAPNHFTRNNAQDLVILRFADILLMGAELGSANAQTYLDKVRSRVNLPSVTVSLENIKAERKYELAFEGERYWDLLRWHDAEAAFEKVKNVPILTGLVETTMTIQFRSETGGFLPIPQSEIDLSDGGIVQNSGWTGADSNW